MRHYTKTLLTSALLSTALAGPALAQDKDPIVFATAIILSGPFKVTDAQNLAGVQYAVKQINDAGGINGHPIKLDVIDTELNAATTKRKFTNEILTNHAKVIIGSTGSDVLKALVAVGQQYHVPVVSFAGEADDLTGEHFQPALFRVAANTSMHTAAAVYGVSKVYPDTQKIFLLNEDYAYGHESDAGFKAALHKLLPNAQIVGDVYHPRGIADFSPYLQQIQASGANIVLTADWGADSVKLLSQAGSFGLKAHFAGIFLVDPEILKNVGNDSAIGDVGADIFLSPPATQQAQDFVNGFHQAYANTDTPYVTASIAKSYLATILAADAFKKSNTTDFDGFVHALEGYQTSSIAGPLTVRACDHEIQVGQVYGVVGPATGKPYNFPYITQSGEVPLSAIEVAPQDTGNPRCK